MISGFVAPLLYEPARHVYRLLRKERYRTYCRVSSRLRRIPRFSECRVAVHGWDLRVPDSASFLSTYHDLFVDEHYGFLAGRPDPVIIDVGANIGLSVLYFKLLYPRARITAFEADPHIFEFLRHNVCANGFTDVELIDKAAWVSNTTLTFQSEGGDGGFVGARGGREIQVPAIDFASYLAGRRIDFLKMDIEGAESEVLPACAPHLAHVERVFVEYHSPADQRQSLDRIIAVLAQAGFRLHVRSIGANPSPFRGRHSGSRFDLQLDISAWRP